MPFPPDIIVRNASTMKAVADAVDSSARHGGGFLHQTAAYLEPKIVATLQKYGLDGSNRFGFGSDAKKAASSVTDLLRKAAEKFIDGGKLVGYAYLAYMKNVKGPIDASKNAQKTKSSVLDE
jgi:hypothetical protein